MVHDMASVSVCKWCGNHYWTYIGPGMENHWSGDFDEIINAPSSWEHSDSRLHMGECDECKRLPSFILDVAVDGAMHVTHSEWVTNSSSFHQETYIAYEDCPSCGGKGWKHVSRAFPLGGPYDTQCGFCYSRYYGLNKGERNNRYWHGKYLEYKLRPLYEESAKIKAERNHICISRLAARGLCDTDGSRADFNDPLTKEIMDEVEAEFRPAIRWIDAQIEHFGMLASRLYPLATCEVHAIGRRPNLLAPQHVGWVMLQADVHPDMGYIPLAMIKVWDTERVILLDVYTNDKWTNADYLMEEAAFHGLVWKSESCSQYAVEYTGVFKRPYCIRFHYLWDTDADIEVREERARQFRIGMYEIEAQAGRSDGSAFTIDLDDLPSYEEEY